MALILNIDTSLDTASVCLGNNDGVLQVAINDNQKDHAAWIHTAINKLLKETGFPLKSLEAIAVSIGPGSYTGLRIGLSSAKGLCYALDIPLITISTLKMIASAVKQNATDLICPMVDARRMEVFTGLYNRDLLEISAARALIIDETSFDTFLSSHKILFCGNGSKKLQNILSSPNASFIEIIPNASQLSDLSQNCYINKQFANLAYSEPLYIKEFYTPGRKD